MPSSEGASATVLERTFVPLHPDVWADDLFSRLPDFEDTDDCAAGEEHEEMKQEIRSMLLKGTNHPSEKLKLIDIVQRLGIAYHFKAEIEDELTKILNINFEEYHTDLYHVALRFRLLRQQGFRVSCDVFEKFKDEDGNFKESLSEDTEGLLSLYEAAFLGIRGDDILDEAIDFATKKLQLLLPNLSPNLAKEVAHTLTQSIRRNVSRLETLYFIGVYETDESHNKTLAKFAKLDFNMLQVLHQKELKHYLKWWKQWDFTKKLFYARQRTWETHCWVVGVNFEPQYSEGKVLLTKVMSLFTIVDDTYDNYGRTEELESFTQAVQRWDVGAIGDLPEYLQVIFRSLISIINEIEEIATREGKPFLTYYTKKFIKEVLGYYLTEVKWRDAKYVPTIDEYLQVCSVSTCYPMLTVISFIGMGEIATKEAFEWISNYPKSMKASAIICRLMDDIVTHKFEQESRDHVASAVECYMKQYQTSEEEAVKVLKKKIEDAWKDINEDLLSPLPVAKDIVEMNLRFSQVMDVFYKETDGYTNALVIKDRVASILKDPLL